MVTNTSYPRIISVKPLTGKRLLVGFSNGVTKVYDCTPLIANEAFKPLSDEALFRSVHPEPNGYGVIWSDEIDLAESELWINGKITEPSAQRDVGEEAP